MKLALLVVATAWLALAEDALPQSGESEALLAHGCLEPEPEAWQRLAENTLNLSGESEAVVEPELSSSNCAEPPGRPPGGPGPVAWQQLAEDALMQSNESDAALELALEPSCAGSDGEYNLQERGDPTDASHKAAGPGDGAEDPDFNLTVIISRTKKGHNDKQTSLQANSSNGDTRLGGSSVRGAACQRLVEARLPTAGTDNVPSLPAAGNNDRDSAPGVQW